MTFKAIHMHAFTKQLLPVLFVMSGMPVVPGRQSPFGMLEGDTDGIRQADLGLKDCMIINGRELLLLLLH